MKLVNKSLLKYYLKYLTYALALLIMIIQLSIIFFGNKQFEEKSMESKNFYTFSTKEEYCERKNSAKYVEYLAKCFLAFFSGCLISESRFLRFGVI